MSDIIQLLPEYVANQIAAGEVVQRPSSVVKELLENSLDANASQIRLIIKDAGKTLIQVIDNGKGMSQTDARMCFERHATSKIKKTEDLFKINTKGFRGEAMASIAAVAQVELKTKTKEDEIGVKINIEGSKVLNQEPVATPCGTNIAVKNLFFNVPARRKFLKSDNIETRHLINEFQRVALSNPNIHFIAQHNDTELYNLPEANLKKRIVDIMGNRFNEKLVPIDESTDIANIEGYIVKSDFAKKTRGEQFFFVNQRYIKSDYLNHAVKKAFEGIIAQERYPGYFLFLTLDPKAIDINIHPTKTEIKFDCESDLYAILYATIKKCLGQYHVAPVLDFNHDSGMDLPYDYNKKLPEKEPTITVDRNYNPFITQNSKSEQQQSWKTLYTDVDTSTSHTQKLSSSPYIEQEQSILNENLFDSNEYNTHKTQQLQNKYIVSTIKSGLVFIHQNKAHQRILYEDYLSKLTEGVINSQQLLYPIQINLTQNEILILKGLVEDLMEVGFSFETIQEDHFVLNGIPTGINEMQTQIFIEDLVLSHQETHKNHHSIVDLIAKSLARSTAIKVGQTIDPKSQEALVDNLFNCKDPLTSPFGGKCYTTLTIEDIDRKL